MIGCGGIPRNLQLDERAIHWVRVLKRGAPARLEMFGCASGAPERWNPEIEVDVEVSVQDRGGKGAARDAPYDRARSSTAR